MISGIDEAGRGSLIGPLVISRLTCSDYSRLLDMGVKDSKRLSDKKRRTLFNELLSFCDIDFVLISPEEIDRFLISELEAKAMAYLMKSVRGKVFIDLPEPKLSTFRLRVRKYGCHKKFVAEHKAEEKFPIVAAASICAKVRRDDEIEKIKQHINYDFGSGYPSDKKTKLAVMNVTSLIPYIRKKWKIKL